MSPTNPQICPPNHPFRNPQMHPPSWLKAAPKSVLQINPSKSPIAPPFLLQNNPQICPNWALKKKKPRTPSNSYPKSALFVLSNLLLQNPTNLIKFWPKSSKNYALTLLNSNEQVNSNAK